MMKYVNQSITQSSIINTKLQLTIKAGWDWGPNYEKQELKNLRCLTLFKISRNDPLGKGTPKNDQLGMGSLLMLGKGIPPDVRDPLWISKVKNV